MPLLQIFASGLRRRLVVLTLVCVLPAAVIMSLLLAREWHDSRVRQERDLALTTRALVRAVDQDLAGLQSALTVLAGAADPNDSDALRMAASSARNTLRLDDIFLSTAQGELSWSLAAGLQPPRESIAGAGHRKDSAWVSDIFAGGDGRYRVSVLVRVRTQADPSYVLGGTFPAARLSSVFAIQSLPPSWIVAVYDASGRIVARTHDQDRFVGQRSREENLREMAGRLEGSFTGTTVQGSQVQATYSRSPATGWTVIIGIPKSELTEAVLKTVANLAVATLLLFLGGLGLAFVVSRGLRTRLANEELRSSIGQSRAAENRMRTIIEAAQDPFAAFDLEGRVQEWNTQAEVTFGWPKEEIVGTGVQSMMPPDVGRQFESLLRSVRANGQSLPARPIESVLNDHNGRGIPVEVKMALVDTGEQRFIAAFVYDVSARKELEKMKDELIATASHELRTPLTGMYGCLSLLRSGAAGELTGDARNFVNVAFDSCDRLVRLVNDMLDVEKLAAGKVDYQFAPHRMRELVERAARETQPFADQHGVALAVTGEDEAVVTADADRIVQVLVNLMSNAIKFSPRGQSVELRLERVAPQTVRVGVIDQGPGVPAQFRARLFQRFAQSETGQAKGGTGLGLSISQSIVEAHGGRIGLNEKFPPTEFYIELPAEGAPSAPVAP
jgi:PAS domain S-box-containing protein